MIIFKYIDAIASIDLFSGFTKEELIQLFSTSKYWIKTYEKDQMIHIQNEVCHTMDIILEGEVTVQNMDVNGNVLTVHVFSARDILGANLLFSKRNLYPMSVVSKSKATLLQLDKALVLALCQRNVDFMTSLLSEISDKTIILTDKINTISLKTIRQCIIDFLKYEHHMQKSDVIELGMTKKDLAERLGIQRSSLSRELNKMRKDGLVEFDAKTITIKNIDI